MAGLYKKEDKSAIDIGVDDHVKNASVVAGRRAAPPDMMFLHIVDLFL
jgi:hypothetical protein